MRSVTGGGRFENVNIGGPALVLVFPLGERPYIIEVPDPERSLEVFQTLRETFPQFVPVLEAWAEATWEKPGLEIVE